jgi:Pyruvate/2-oxoacid:ferredoxin oxidoreductase delta subunit
MDKYTKAVIYYFSGTGNARQAARWIAERAVAGGLETTVVNIADIDRRHVQQPPADALVGFCSPTHGFNIPPIMLHFIFHFPRGRNNVFLVNTRAGMKIGRHALPGLSGIAELLPALVLLLKGYAIVGMRPIDLPSNWISLHPGLTNNAIEFLFQRFRKIATAFANRLLAGKRDYRALYDLVPDLIIAPVSIGYYLVGRFAFAKSFYASRECDNCGVCIKQCPIQAISLVDGRPFWSYHCESCMHCMNNCPKRAIQTAHGYIIGILVLLSAFVQPALYRLLATAGIGWFEEASISGFVCRFALSAVITFGVIVSTYRVMHHLLRFRIFRGVVRYTSLTPLAFWRRYKPVLREIERKG